MPTVFVVNSLDTLVPSQSTWALASRVAEHDDVWVAGAAQLGIAADGQPVAHARRWRPEGPDSQPRSVPLAASRVWCRLNPGRVARPETVQVALEILAMAEGRGARVRNRPGALWACGSKTNVMLVPASCRPDSVVTADAAEAVAWAGDRPSVVIKPLIGTRGQGVEQVSREALGQRLDGTQPWIVQAFLPRADEGDVRVHVVDGDPLMVGGEPAIVRRVPAAGEFRSNVALGGRPTAAAWTAELQEVVAGCGPALRALGLWHVGLDIVGGKVVELNVHSPGGLQDCGRFAGVDYVNALCLAFLQDS